MGLTGAYTRQPQKTPKQPKQMGIIGPLLSAGASIFGGLFGQGSARRHQRKTDERQYKHQKEMAKYAYSKDLEMWNRSNTYNTPQQQMERLKQGGLNPNLVYGSGAQAQGASQLPKYNAPTADYKAGPTADFQGMLGQYVNIEQQKASINLTNKQAEVAQQTAKNKWMESANIGKKGKAMDQSLKIADGLYPAQLSFAEEKTRTQQQVTLNTTQQALYNKYKAKLAKEGIQTTDNLILRQMALKGASISQMLKAVKNYFTNGSEKAQATTNTWFK